MLDRARKMALQMRVVDIEALLDELRMAPVFGEDDRLAEPVAAGDILSILHQMPERLIDGIGIEEPGIQLMRIDFDRNAAVLVPFDRVPFLLLLLGELVISDAFANEFERHRHSPGRDQIFVGDGVIKG